MDTSLSEALRETLAVFDGSGTPLTTGEVAGRLELGRQRTYERLERLVDEGHLETKRIGSNGRVWWRPVVEGNADTTGRHSAADRLLEDLLETVEAGVFVFDADLEVAWVNDAAVEYFGLDDLDVLGRDRRVVLEDAVAPVIEDSTGFTDQLLSTNEGTATDRLEWHVLAGEGRRERWLEYHSEQIETGPYAGGRIELYYDVTGRRRAEHELEEVFDRIDDAVHGLDTEWRFTYLNDRAEELLGKSEEELLGTYVWDAFPDDLDRSYRNHYERAMETQEPVVFEEYSEAVDAWLEVATYPSESGLSVYFHDVTERKARERELERQRERLAALNDLNGVVNDITEAIITRSTREEIEETVCERLARAQSYEVAWTGGVDTSSQTIEPRTEVGGDGYLEDVTISVDPDDPMGQGPAGTAVRNQEMQIVSDALTDPDFEPWREHAQRHGYRSAAAIPIVHEDTLYGLLGVHSARPEAFEGEEGEVISQLGEVVGHAIAAVERKQALLSDEVVELEFRIRDVFEAFGVDDPATGSITLEQTVPLKDDEYLLYGTATGDAVDSIEAVVETATDEAGVTFWEDGDGTSFELRFTDPPVLSLIPSLGGAVERAVFEDGDCRMTTHLAPTADVRQVIDAVREACSTVELLKHRQTTRNGTDSHVRAVLTEELTDRQRAALEAAYHAGYFEWPRGASGEDVADALEVTSPTFHQHLRLAQQKVFDSLL